MQGEKFDQAVEPAVGFQFIPVLDGRPQRDIPITPDEILNLRIALNTCGSLEEFLADT